MYLGQQLLLVRLHAEAADHGARGQADLAHAADLGQGPAPAGLLVLDGGVLGAVLALGALPPLPPLGLGHRAGQLHVVGLVCGETGGQREGSHWGLALKM